MSLLAALHRSRMPITRGVALLAGLWLACHPGAGASHAAENVRFRAIDIFIEPNGKPLAAYQINFAAVSGSVKIAGVEGGEHAAFTEAPHYDPRAMRQERVIIAAFNTAPPERLPTVRTRVATIHVQITGRQTPEFQIKLSAAADHRGAKLQARVDYEEREAP